MKLMKILSATILLAFGSSATANAAVIGFEETLNADESELSVGIIISDLADDYIGAYSIDVLFNEAILALTGVNQAQIFGLPLPFGPGVYGNSLDGSSPTECFDGTTVENGCLNMNGFTLDNSVLAGLQDGISVLLATLTFDVESVDGFGLGFFLSVDAGRDVKNQRNDVIVPAATQVPEPGTLALLGLGLFGVAAARRRRMRR